MCITSLALRYVYTNIHTYIYRERDRLVSFRKDSRPNPSTQIQPSDIRIQDSLRWSWPILFQVSINQKSRVLNTFCPSIKSAKWTSENSELVRIISLDIQILDPAIWLWSKHLKTPTNQFLLGFKCSTQLN